MRIIITTILFLASAHAFSDGWEGSTVKVPAGTLMCEYSAIEAAMELDGEGGAKSLDSTLEKSACLYSPRELKVKVSKEAFDSEGLELIEVTIGRTSIWVAKSEAECCFD